jgi:hypothetical protein
MEHLSPAWIAAYDEIVRAHAGLRQATSDRRVVIELTVTSEPVRARRAEPGTTDTVYTVVLDHGDNRVLPGPHPEPDITLRTDRATAAAIASHAESAQAAFMAGRLRLGGDVRVLIATQDVLAEVDDCARALREQTELGVVPDGATGA